MLEIEIFLTDSRRAPPGRKQELLTVGYIETITANIIKTRYTLVKDPQPPKLLKYTPTRSLIGYSRELAALLYYDLISQVPPQDTSRAPLLLKTLSSLEKRDLKTYFHYGVPILSEKSQTYHLILKSSSPLKCHLKWVLQKLPEKTTMKELSQLLAYSIRNHQNCSSLKQYKNNEGIVVIGDKKYFIEARLKKLSGWEEYQSLQITINNKFFTYELSRPSESATPSVPDRVKQLILLSPKTPLIRPIKPTRLFSGWWGDTKNEVEAVFSPAESALYLTYRESSRDSQNEAVIKTRIPVEESNALPLRLSKNGLIISYLYEGLRFHIEIPNESLRKFPHLYRAAVLIKTGP